MHPPVPLDYLPGSPVKGSKFQYEVPTEILQAIFLELATIDDARSVIATCFRMYDAFKGYRRTIMWTILSRELRPTLPGTFGALAIFVSPRKTPVDEPLFLEGGISARYWAPMLREHGELARRILTLGMASRMVAVYRNFPNDVGYSPGGECSACVSSMLADIDWDPRYDNTIGNCLEHLLQANAVRFRLTCRMVLDYEEPAEILDVGSLVYGGWWDSWYR